MNTNICFIHVKFGEDYLEYLDADNKDIQRKLIDNLGKDNFAYMKKTTWINLESQKGRELALCHIFALLRWHEKHMKGNVSTRNQEENDSEAEGLPMDMGEDDSDSDGRSMNMDEGDYSDSGNDRA